MAGKRDQPDTASEFKEPPAKRLKSSDQETTAQEKPETHQNSQEEDLRWDSSQKFSQEEAVQEKPPLNPLQIEKQVSFNPNQDQKALTVENKADSKMSQDASQSKDKSQPLKSQNNKPKE